MKRLGLRLVRWTGTLWMVAALGACGAAKGVAIDTLVGSLEEGSGALRGYFDWETAGIGAASGVMQLEALYDLRPENEGLALALAKSYMAYTYGWVSDAAEAAEAKADFDGAEYHQQRAYLMYDRAKKIALQTMIHRDEEVKKYLTRSPDEFMEYLRRTYEDPEDDLGPIYWLMMTWSSAINNSSDGSEFADMPYVKMLARRVLELDPAYGDAGALAFMGGLYGSYPEALGGNHPLASCYFERALKLTERRNHIVHVNYAKLYAVAAQDRELFVRLLEEVVEAEDQGDHYRMGNIVARRRAERYLSQVDEFFME